MQVTAPASQPFCTEHAGHRAGLPASGMDAWSFLPPTALPAQLHGPSILPQAQNTHLLLPAHRWRRDLIAPKAESQEIWTGIVSRLTAGLSCRCWADSSTSPLLREVLGAAPRLLQFPETGSPGKLAAPGTNWQTWQTLWWGWPGSEVLLCCTVTLPATEASPGKRLFGAACSQPGPQACTSTLS